MEILIKKIDFKAPQTEPLLRIKLWGQYPAKEALIKIGEPTLDPLINALSVESNELRRHLMCDALRQTAGAVAAQKQIAQRIAAEPDSARKADLALVAAELKK